jgi:hypothetical protein
MAKIDFRNFWVVGLGGLFIIGLIFLWVFFVGVKADKTGAFYNTGQNAVWIAHEWAEEPKNGFEIQNLVMDLSRHDIDTIFLHVGPLREDGLIAPSTYQATVNFVDKVKRYGDNIKVLAWMGQIRGKIDLGNPQVRHNILSMCTIFVDMVGMDGVHYDIEPVWDGDEDFIALLEETRRLFDRREELGAGRAVVSVALAEFIPSSFVWWTEELTGFENYNTEVNYLNVAKHADQIVDMVYDTGIDRGWLYRWLVKEQVIWVSDLIGSEEAAGTEFLIGVPTYDSGGEGFNPEVENIENAMLGILDGLNDIRSSHENFTGIAIYSEWETSDDEWAVYDGLWNE